MTSRKEIQKLYKNLVDEFIEVKKWLNSNLTEKQKNERLRALTLFMEFTGKNPKQLIDEYIEDEGKDARAKANPAKTQITAFKKYLTEDMERPLSSNSAITYLGHVLGFYSHVTENSVFFTRDEKKIFKRTKNKKLKTMITVSLIKEILTHTKKLRDRAIILCLASSGMPIGDLLQLQWGDIKEDFVNEHESLTIKVDTNRIKNQTRYVTFFSPEAVQALKIYFKMERNIPQEIDEYIFLQMRNIKNKPLAENYILRSIKEVALKVTKKPITPYSFRRFFRTTMRMAKMDKFYIDILTAHKVDESDKAYDLISEPSGHEELRHIYIEYLPAITILNGNNVKSSVKELQKENQEMKKEIALLHDVVKDQQQQLKKIMEFLEKKKT
ncbi:MAG: tyrosine-type recombinase/integrase [Promethearchaeota archaeon]